MELSSSFITIFSCIFLKIWAREPIKRYVIVKSFNECREYKNLSVQIRNLSAYAAQRNVYEISGEVVYKETVSYGAKGALDVQKCPDTSGNVESCKQFIPRITIKNMCELLDIDGTALTKFTSLIEPPLRCPLHGSYKINAIPIDAELMNYMPIGNVQSYYVTLIGEYKSKKIFCIKFYIQVRPRRS